MDTKLYKILRPIIKFIFKILYRPTIIGKEFITVDESLILAGNHTNVKDAFLLITASNRQVHFMAKDSLFAGINGLIMRGMGCIPVNRKIHDHGALEQGYSYLRNNKVIGIFPEGTINRGNQTILPFKIGAVKMSSETSSKIIPFTITGKYKLFRKSIVIEFYDGMFAQDDLDNANINLMKIISDKLEEKRD